MAWEVLIVDLLVSVDFSAETFLAYHLENIHNMLIFEKTSISFYSLS